MAETILPEMLPVQTPVEIPTCGDRRGEECASCVERLEDVVYVAASRDLFDQFRR